MPTPERRSGAAPEDALCKPSGAPRADPHRKAEFRFSRLGWSSRCEDVAIVNLTIPRSIALLRRLRIRHHTPLSQLMTLQPLRVERLDETSLARPLDSMCVITHISYHVETGAHMISIHLRQSSRWILMGVGL